MKHVHHRETEVAYRQSSTRAYSPVAIFDVSQVHPSQLGVIFTQIQ